MIYYRKTLFGRGPKLTAVRSIMEGQAVPITINYSQDNKFIFTIKNAGIKTKKILIVSHRFLSKLKNFV